MGPRGKQKFKAQKRNKKQKSKHVRKTYSLFSNKASDTNKRKFNEIEEENKRRKIESEIQKKEESFLEEVEEEEEEEVENHMQKLLETFDPKIVSKMSIAIESDTSDSDSETDECETGKDLERSRESDSFEEEEMEETENTDLKYQSNLTAKTNKNEVCNVKQNHDEKIIEDDEIDIETQKGDENPNEDFQDPFSRHLSYDLSDNLVESLQNAYKTTMTEMLEWNELGKLQIQIPTCEQQQKIDLKLAEARPFAPLGTIPVRINLSKQSFVDICIKSQIKDNLWKANKVLNSDKQSDMFLTPLQCEIFSVINNYQDFYYSQRTLENGEEIRFVYCLHAVNHILKTRTKVLHHNAKLAQKDDVPEEFRDQGLVRPKVLILVPFRDSAYRIINFITDILLKEDKGNVINKTRLLEEFTGHELALPKKNPKPEDYERLFSGNIGDEFKIGITITKKSLKLFADFYSSDIIIASPLGLRTIIGAEGELDRDYDFLASIELLILDQTDIFLMQNWDHVIQIFKHMHLQPKDSHGTDFSRVRTWTLNGWSKYYRQTLLFSSVVLPEINAIFNKRCFNYAGKIKTINPVKFGTICQVYVQLPHVYQKLCVTNVTETVVERFNFFISKLLPQYSDMLMRQTLIYVANYFDYIKLRNYFKREDIGFVQICEYSKEGKIARARDMFYHGNAHFLLYTERFHFFNRIRVKGIRHLIFYSPPTFPHFYYEMCNLMQEANMNKKIGSISNMTVTVLYSKYDINQLAAIVGTERAIKMVESDRNVHMLVTDAKSISAVT